MEPWVMWTGAVFTVMVALFLNICADSPSARAQAYAMLLLGIMTPWFPADVLVVPGALFLATTLWRLVEVKRHRDA
jgi:hypothetical protein